MINAINPTKNVHSGGIMNLEKGYEMDPIWSGFNGVFREMMDGKILKDQWLSFSFIFCYCLYVFHILWQVGISSLVSEVWCMRIFCHICICMDMFSVGFQ